MQVIAYDFAIKVKQGGRLGWRWSVMDRDGVEITAGEEAGQADALSAAERSARSLGRLRNRDLGFSASR